MLGNSSCPRPLAVLADLDRAAKVLGTRFARLACFPMGRKHPQGAVMRFSRFSRLARALRERPRLARVSGRPRRASNASGLDPLDAAPAKAATASSTAADTGSKSPLNFAVRHALK